MLLRRFLHLFFLNFLNEMLQMSNYTLSRTPLPLYCSDFDSTMNRFLIKLQTLYIHFFSSYNLS